MMLFIKELKKTVFSITFAVLLIAMSAFMISQDVMNFSDKIIALPQKGADYGIQQKEIPEIIMPAALNSLYTEFSSNEYVAYPIGFYKCVKLSDTDREKMSEIISALSGISADDVKNGTAVTLSDGISYTEFKKYMKQADALIGGGSSYSEDNLTEFCYVPITYGEALESYNLIASEDKFTGAYARLFCDYAGIVLSILPVFSAVALCLKDKRAKMHELIYSRKISSSKLIFSRYFSIITAVMIPTLLLAYISNASVWGHYSSMDIDYFSPLKYTFGWLMPSVMISASIGIFFTELTDTPIGIGIQCLWWLFDINVGTTRFSGMHTLFELIPRHNSLGNTQAHLDSFDTLLLNRLILVFVALTLVFVASIIYEQKRKGNFNGYEKIKTHFTNFKNRKSKHTS